MSASTQLSFFGDEPEPEEESKPFQMDLFACFEKQYGHIVLNEYVLYEKKPEDMSREEQIAFIEMHLELKVKGWIELVRRKNRVIEGAAERIVDKWLSRIMHS